MWQTVSEQRRIGHPPDHVWAAITNPDQLAEWMYPTDFDATVGKSFTLRPPANPHANFDGTVRGQVLIADAPRSVAYTWNGGPVVGTVVRIRLAEDGDSTQLELEHSGFDVSEPWGEAAFRGAEYGWRVMLDKLGVLLDTRST